MNDEELVPFLNHLADRAAEETLPRFRQLKHVDNKLEVGFDPVTQADREAERVIRETITQKFPDHGLIGEEFGSYKLDAEHSWVIDPVDGTRAFISGIPVWGTLIALCRNMVPVAGIMSQPFTGERYIATGKHAKLFHQSEEKKLATSDTDSLESAILMATTPEMFDPDETVAFEKIAGQCKLVRYGADCYAYCLLAAGHIDLVVESGLNFYDIAALIPIVEGSGGRVTDWSGNSHPRGGRILASANPSIHAAALEVLQTAA
ncbi:MAG: histidinol-phosphatase [Pseudomonadota bacterium]